MQIELSPTTRCPLCGDSLLRKSHFPWLFRTPAAPPTPESLREWAYLCHPRTTLPYWTDGDILCELHDRGLAPSRCGGCRQLFWFYDAPGEFPDPESYGDMSYGPGFFNAWREGDFYEAIRGGLGRTSGEERALRTIAWRVHNDLFRDPRLLESETAAEAEDHPAAPHPTVDASGYPSWGPTPPATWWRQNMGALLTLLEPDADHVDRILAAELCRGLGWFDKARALLDAGPVPAPLRAYAQVVSERAAREDVRIWPVFGDEADVAPADRWPQRLERQELERIEAEKAAAVSRAAWAQRQAEERAAEAERERERDLRREAAARGYLEWREREQVRKAELVALNRACPRCGLTYAWNGHRCGHCRHPDDRRDVVTIRSRRIGNTPHE